MLRTIWDFDLLQSPRASYRCRATLINPGNLNKKSNPANHYRWRHEHCTQKEHRTRGKGFIDENGGGPGVRLRKRQQKKGQEHAL
jgi:hypothetical protein